MKSNGLYKNIKNATLSDSSNMFMEEEKVQSKLEASEEKREVTATNVSASTATSKEVLNYENMNVLEIKLDHDDDEEEEEVNDQEETDAPHLPARLPVEEGHDIKPPSTVESSSEKKKDEATSSSGGAGGSLKLKLKVVKSGADMVVQVAKSADDLTAPSSRNQAQSIDDLIRKSDNEEEEHNNHRDDDELIKELKNSYQDNDFGMLNLMIYNNKKLINVYILKSSK